MDPALIELINRAECISSEEFYSDVILGVSRHVSQVGTALRLYNRDVDGALISFRLYKQCREGDFAEQVGARNSEATYHAACFVCAAYRALRTLEQIQGEGFSDPKGRGIAELLRLVRRREACFRKELKLLRDPIEHIDRESVKPENMAFFNMWNDRLFVATEKVYKGPSVDVNEAAERLRKTRDEVMWALANAYVYPRTSDVVRQATPYRENAVAEQRDYEIHRDVKYGCNTLIDVPAIVRECTAEWFNQSLCLVNDCVVRLAVVRGEFHWHKHDEEDEFFFVLSGKLLLDTDQGTIELGPQQGFVVPKGATHRTRAPERTVVLVFEKSSVEPTGD